MESSKPYWLVERWINNRLHYYAPGSRGRGSRDDWSTDVFFALRLARMDDATMALLGLCDGEGRTAEHMDTQP